MSEPEYTSTALAYTCRDCGRAMRTRGVDGRCLACVEPPPVRCERCRRVRHGAGQDWFDHPGAFDREVLGMCARCGAEKHQEAERLYYRNARAVERRKAKGYGPAAEGEDVFRGFREE